MEGLVGEGGVAAAAAAAHRPTRRVIVLIKSEPMLWMHERPLVPDVKKVFLLFPELPPDYFYSESTLLRIRRRVLERVQSIRPFDSGETHVHGYRSRVVKCRIQFYRGRQSGGCCCWKPKPSPWRTLRLDRLEEYPQPLVIWPTPLSLVPLSYLRITVCLRLEPIHCTRPVFHDFFDAVLHKRNRRRRRRRPLPPQEEGGWLVRKMAALGLKRAL